MVGFYTKKAFFDGWDNFLQMILQNLLYIALFILYLLSFMVIPESTAALFLVTCLALFLLSFLMGGTAAVVKNWSDYSSETWPAFSHGLVRNIGHSVFHAALLIIVLVIFTIVVPFYSSMGGLVGVAVSVVMIWVAVFVLIALMYYFPLTQLLPADGPVKTFRKCFLIAGDNPGATLYLILHSVVDIVTGVLTVGLLSGVAGAMLGQMDMMKLLMMKYDWLEANPDKKGRDVDWEALLHEEKELVGPRSLRSMIFPWK